jgi:hypothetical protein
VEHYTIERMNSSVNNLIFGEMYVEHYGILTVKNLQLRESCAVDFKKRGWSGKNAFEVEGYAFKDSAPKDKLARIWGHWTESLSCQFLKNGSPISPEECLWTANPLPPQSASMYHFTYFTL